jgi:glutamate racemase
VVLGCTHYPLLLEELKEAAPWPVRFIDPAEAIARQALRVAKAGYMEESSSHSLSTTCENAYLVVSDSNKDNESVARVIMREGFAIHWCKEEG